ncbi:radical SAM protein [Patescibacteria group bacterium]|nr:MAG: radical SAM protein [Patescibacteria group bacterium]
MVNGVHIQEIKCKIILGKCGFPGGGLSINPYVGCAHDCRYCYARFMKRFTGHTDRWGSFVDVRLNAAEVLEKQLKSAKYAGQRIYIGTVTDPYQAVEKEYEITKQILNVLVQHDNPVSILTKSDLVVRDIGLLRQLKDVDVNITINTLDEQWKEVVEPGSPSIQARLDAIQKLTESGITVNAMIGPYWPVFTDAPALLAKLKQLGVAEIFTESFNTTGSNWTGVEIAMRKRYPGALKQMKEILFDQQRFHEFYAKVEQEMKVLSRQFDLPVHIHFGRGHAGKIAS